MVAIIGGITSSYLASASGLITSSSVAGTSIGSIIGIKYGLDNIPIALQTLMAKSAGGGAVASAVIGPIVAGAIGKGWETATASTISSIAGAVSGAGASAFLAMGLNPFGSAILGASECDGIYSFDCWKPILHDESVEPSKGVLLKDVINDSRIQNMDVGDDFLLLLNIWDEKFLVYFMELPWGQIGAHAVKI